MGSKAGSPVRVRYIGIDPGLTGALAVLDVHENGHRGYSATRTPTVRVEKNGRRRDEYDIPAMHGLLTMAIMAPPPTDTVVIVIEESSPMRHKATHICPKCRKPHGGQEGSVSSFRLGMGFMVWLTLAAVVNVPARRVLPVVWKRLQGLLKADKGHSRLKAKQLFPKEDFSLVKDHGRAEALLIADYGRRMHL